MLLHYQDILALTDKPPLWWDDHGVPRWCEFTPNETGIYCDEAVLFLIRCQFCHREFQVGVGVTSMEQVMRERASLASAIKDGSLHYGDPPNVDCCPGGSSSNCEDLRVLQYWKREKFDWVQHPELEIGLADSDEEKSDD